MGVGRLVDDVGRIGDLGMRGAVDGLALVAVVHVAVAADRRVGRPLVAGNAHEATGLVEFAGERVELAPERAGDLEVVALVAHHVEEGLVAAELEVFARRVGAQRLVRLPVRIAPEVHQRRVRGHARAGDWTGTAPAPSSSSTRMARSPGVGHSQARRRRRQSCPAQAQRSAGKSGDGRDRPRSRASRSTRSDGLPHLSSALIDRRNGSPARTRVGSTARQRTPGPGTIGDLRALAAARRSRRWRSDRRTRGTRIRSRNRSAGGCPASPRRRSPKRMVMVSPGARKSFTTPM